MRRWDELSQSLGEAAEPADVTGALVSALATAFPRASLVVALESESQPGLTIAAVRLGDGGPHVLRDDPVDDGAGAASVRRGRCRRRPRPGRRGRGRARPRRRARRARSARSTRCRCARARGVRSARSRCCFPDEQTLDRADEALVVAQAEHAGRALTRARRYEQEHEVAIALQRSLLPETLPAVEGVDLAGRYSAGGVGLEVGGDWYDALRRPDGIVHLTVGDVAGTRHRRRGADGPAPQRLPRARLRAHLARRDRAAHAAARPGRGHGDGGLPHLRPVHGRARVLLGRPSADAAARRARPARSPRSTGRRRRRSAGPRARRSSEKRMPLNPQTALLAYTDGLVERRGASIDDGIELLRQLLGENADAARALGVRRGAEQRARDVAGRRRHGAAARPRDRGAGDDGDRGALRPGRDADGPAARRHLARAARDRGRPARGHGARDHRGLQQRDRARLPRPGRHDPADARPSREHGSRSRSRTRAGGASRGPTRRAGAAS